MPDGKDHINHVADFINKVRTRDKNTACTIENGALCAKYAHLGNISALLGTDLVYDDVKKKFDNKEANKMLIKEYRKPWRRP